MTREEVNTLEQALTGWKKVENLQLRGTTSLYSLILETFAKKNGQTNSR